MISKLCAFILRIWGWKIKGDYPHHLDRIVIVPIPHTSNWDFPIGILIRNAEKANIKFIAKSSLFKPPFGWIFHALGGVPVERSRRNRFVDSMVEVFEREKRLHTCIAPEGTRKRVDKLKSGFYHIAKGAKAYILPIAFDWGKMTLTWGEAFRPSENIEDDIERLNVFFKGVEGRIPENGYRYNA